MINRHIVSWDKFRQECEVLAQLLEHFGEIPKTLVAITRGGLYVAAELSQLLDIRDIRTVCVSSYDDHKQVGMQIHYISTFDPTSSLVVDDLVDSGKTLSWLQTVVEKQLFTAVLYTKPHSIYRPTFSVDAVDSDTWVVFPWEA